MENKKNKSVDRLPWVFGVLFAGFMIFSMMAGSLMRTGGWLRNANNGWNDFRKVFPGVISGIIHTQPDNFGYGFGKHYNRPADERITIAAIDEHTLNNLGYPFPRKYYGRLIENLNKNGAKVIAMDVFILDPDKRDPASDREFVEAVRKAGNVVNLFNPDVYNNKFSYPIRGITEGSRYLAIPNVEASLDADGQVRRIYPFSQELKYSDLKGVKLGCPPEECGEIGVAGLSAAAYAVFSDMPLPMTWTIHDNLYMLNFRYPVARLMHPGWQKDGSTTLSIHRYISFLDIVNNKLSKEERAAIKGGVVFVGSTAMGAFDHYPSVYMKPLPGVEVHANVVDNLINGDYIRPISGIAVGLLLICCIFIVLSLRKFSTHVIVFSTMGITAVLVVADYLLLIRYFDLSFMTLFIGVFVPFVFVVVHKAVMEGREKKWIKNTFGQYLSPKVVELITKDPSKLSLGGEKRDMTAFFLDLAGFTTMSEKLSPEELTAMLVEYLSAFTDVILKYDGTVDKYIGDCVVAFWNAPLDQADHRKLGVMAAIDCQKEMARLNESLTQFTIKPKCRVGVNSGPMVVGNMGSRSRLSYTVMGDSVNMASRMEGANKYFHSKIMTSEHTFGEIKDFFDYRYLGSIRVVGKAIPTKVYEPFALKGEAAPEVKAMLGHYAAGIEKFYKGDYSGSLPDFKAALAAMPGDGPAQFYVENAEKFAKEPPKNWDQSFNLTEKG